MPEFWVSSGHQLTRRTEGGGLLVTDELLLAYLARPELVPPPEACAAERGLYQRLMRTPRAPVQPGDIAAVEDADARENWQLMLAFRERLLAAPTVEAAYLGLVRHGAAGTPPLFLDQLVHLILRNALEGCGDPFVLRAAELLFRSQRVSTREGAALLADAEIIETSEIAKAASPLLALFQGDAVQELDVLDDENAWTYWSRSDAHTMALNLGANPRSRDGLARAVEAFLFHLLHVRTRIEPVAGIDDHDWRWFVGLDQEATRIGNALWNGEAVDEAASQRVLGLFRLVFLDEERVEPKMAGFPAYLILAMTPEGSLRMKPQNLIVGLPLRAGFPAA